MPTLLLIDGNNYICRGFFAVKSALVNHDGIPTDGIKGTTNIILKDIKTFNPDGIIMCFDRGGSTFRHRLYGEYKANRTMGDSELRKTLFSQFDPTKRLLRAIGIRTLGIYGVESDDIIATLAMKYKSKAEVLICSNDKDFAQLVQKNIKLVQGNNRQVLDTNGVKSKYGVYPHQIVEYLMLIGDDSDNIPGVNGCGPKTASKLLEQYQTLDGILDNLKSLSPALRGKIRGAKSQFKLSRKLITLKTDIQHPAKAFKLKSIDHTELNKICNELDLYATRDLILKTLKDRI